MTDAEKIQEAFNALDLHDSRLIGMASLKAADGFTDEVEMVVDVLEDPYPAYRWRPARLRFTDCTYIAVNLDLDGKRVCGDAIASSRCDGSSAFMQGIAQGIAAAHMRDEKDPLRGYLDFTIELCPPGGTIHVLARGFLLEEMPAH